MKHRLLITGSLVSTTLFYLFWWNTPLLSYLDYKIYDRISHALPLNTAPDSTLVIEIDDKSLKALGQWPWPRLITAKLIESINTAKPKAIILDMVFSEADRTSPKTLRTFYRDTLGMNITITGLPQSLADNDALLSHVFTTAPMVFPIFSSTAMQSDACVLPTTVTYSPTLHTQKLYTLDSLVCNLLRFGQNSHNIGHIHATADGDGILRRLSLAMRHQEVWIPTLGVAAVASLDPNIHFDPVYPLLGDMQLTLQGNRILTGKHSEVLLSFYPPNQYKKISAVDILNGTVDLAKLKDKYLFIGSTALGLDSMHTTSDGSIRSGVYIHATMVENILHNNLRVQPSLYQPLNLILSFLMGVVLLVQMLKKRYLDVVISYFTLSLVASIVVAFAWHYHLYISIGYLIVPLSAYLFVLALLMFFIDYRNKQLFIEALEKSEQEIQYQKAMVFQQSKLAAMGEMIDTIAHQWRQPLNLLGVIIQHAQFAYPKGKMDAQYIRKMSSDSMEQIHFMSQTIDDFRNFVKPDQKNISFDPNQSIQESLRLLSGMFKANNISVEVNYSTTPLVVMGSPSELKQVIINLLQNARDALIQNNQTNPLIRIDITASQTNAIICITDNGGGIPSEIIEQIFDPYFTTKGDKKGSGIGLYISYAIIHTKMKGSITASTHKNETIFTMTLPLGYGEPIP